MALKTRRWTRADLDNLPEDNNRYEVIDGELFVLTAPAPRHELILVVLAELLRPFVKEHRLGHVMSGKPVFARAEDLVIPDLIVSTTPRPLPEQWDDMPLPALVVEVLSPSTARHDRVIKRDFYRRSQIPEYWIVDAQARSVTVVTPTAERTVNDRLTWTPVGCPVGLDIDVQLLFREALD